MPDTPINDVMLATRGLSKRYGARWAVSDLDIEVGRGDVFGFLGPNGAGKTTTIRMMLGLIRPTSGTVLINGHDVGLEPLLARRSVGALVEAPAFYGYLSGRQNLEMLAGISGGVPAGRIEETLEMVGLAGRADDKVRGYSQGMRQRLGIAQALLGRPEVVLLDEPTNGLDPSGIREIRALIPRLAREFGITVFISSHLLNEVEAACGRVAVINEGRLIAGGRVEDLLGREAAWLDMDVSDTGRALDVVRRMEFASKATLMDPSRPEGRGVVRLRAPGSRSAEVNRRLVESGVDVFSLMTHTVSLEELFLRLTGGKSGDSSGGPDLGPEEGGDV